MNPEIIETLMALSFDELDALISKREEEIKLLGALRLAAHRRERSRQDVERDLPEEMTTTCST
jgi:hypothetical protein